MFTYNILSANIFNDAKSVYLQHNGGKNSGAVSFVHESNTAYFNKHFLEFMFTTLGSLL